MSSVRNTKMQKNRRSCISKPLKKMKPRSYMKKKNVERRAEQQRAEQESNESNTKSLKRMRNIMGILFREDADTLLNLIKSIEELRTAHFRKKQIKYSTQQLYCKLARRWN